MAGPAPFRPLPFARPTLSQRMLRRLPRENAVVAINNALAAAGSVRHVSRAEVARICEEHRTSLTGPLAGRFERLYRDYLGWCLRDRHLTGEELADLAHLQTVLAIPAEAAAAIHEHVARQVYSLSVADVLEDGIIDEEERQFLATLQQELALSGRAAHRILEAKMQQRHRPGRH